MKHLFIVNPESFRRKRNTLEQLISEIHAFFRAVASEDYMVYVSQFPRDAAGLIRSFMTSMRQENTVRVYAVGGDGILFDCLNGIMGFEHVELAAIPYGHTNNFIRGFGRQNMALFRDIALQFKSPAVPMDVIHMGGNFALSFCTIGVETEAIRGTLKIHEFLREAGFPAKLLNTRLYDLLYYIGGISASFNTKLRTQYYEIDLDGESFNGHYRSINIANGAYYGGEKCPVRPALPNDGALDIIFSRSRGFLRTVGLIPLYTRGRYAKFPSDFTLKRVKRITIRSESPVLLSLDDIVFFDSNITVEVLPGALRFVDVTGQGYQGTLYHE